MASKDGDPKFLIVGTIVRAFGNKGRLLLEPATDFPDRFQAGLNVHIGESLRRYTIESVTKHGARRIIGLTGIASYEDRKPLIGEVVQIPTSESMPLDEGVYYWYQIIGLTAVLEDGKEVGQVTDISRTGSNDIYVVRAPDGSELLIPAIEDAVLEIDLPARRIVVRLLPED